MAKQNALTIHVPPESAAAVLLGMVRLLAQFQDQSYTAAEMRSFLEEHGLSGRQEIPPTARLLGLLEQDGKSIRLSRLGYVLAQARNELAGDLLHYLFYSAWSDTDPLKNFSAWAYRATCSHYWHLGEIRLDSSTQARLVSAINGEAQVYFSAYGEFGDPSFGPKSLRGIKLWLQALQPPVLTGDIFRRRTFCIPELVVLSLGYSMRAQDDTVNTDILLSRERRDTIAQLCLLAPEHVDPAIDYAMRSFPALLQPGTTAGFYGRFIRLLKIPTVEDVVR